MKDRRRVISAVSSCDAGKRPEGKESCPRAISSRIHHGGSCLCASVVWLTCRHRPGKFDRVTLAAWSSAPGVPRSTEPTGDTCNGGYLPRQCRQLSVVFARCPGLCLAQASFDTLHVSRAHRRSNRPGSACTGPRPTAQPRASAPALQVSSVGAGRATRASWQDPTEAACGHAVTHHQARPTRGLSTGPCSKRSPVAVLRAARQARRGNEWPRAIRGKHPALP